MKAPKWTLFCTGFCFLPICIGQICMWKGECLEVAKVLGTLHALGLMPDVQSHSPAPPMTATAPNSISKGHQEASGSTSRDPTTMLSKMPFSKCGGIAGMMMFTDSHFFLSCPHCYSKFPVSLAVSWSHVYIFIGGVSLHDRSHPPAHGPSSFLSSLVWHVCQ